MFCWKCGDHNPDAYRFCGACGAPRSKHGQRDWLGGSDVNEFARAFSSLADGTDATDGRTAHVSSTRVSHQFKTTNRNGRREIVYVDSHGRRHTYGSIDELPPDVRRIYEAMVRGGFGGDLESPMPVVPREVFDGQGSRDGFADSRAIHRAVAEELTHFRRRRARGRAIAKFFIGLFIVYLLYLWWR